MLHTLHSKYLRLNSGSHIFLKNKETFYVFVSISSKEYTISPSQPKKKKKPPYFYIITYTVIALSNVFYSNLSPLVTLLYGV